MATRVSGGHPHFKTMKISRIFLAIFAIASALSVVACGSSQEESTSSKSYQERVKNDPNRVDGEK